MKEIKQKEIKERVLEEINFIPTGTDKHLIDLTIQETSKQYENKIETFRKSFIKTLGKSNRLVNENDLQNMEFIELSYTGELIPVEAVEQIMNEELQNLLKDEHIHKFTILEKKVGKHFYYRCKCGQGIKTEWEISKLKKKVKQ